MAARLGRNRYGKAGVRLFKVARAGARHNIKDLRVAVAVTGDFQAAHAQGDNTLILPTDTMKNTVYALAPAFTGSNELFGLSLAQHFLENNSQLTSTRIRLEEYLWQRLNDHDHAFTRMSEARRTAIIRNTRAGARVQAGVRGLMLLKTTRSGFVGYIKDRFTTLPETTDRILATVLNAVWDYSSADIDFDAEWSRAQSAIVETFAQHDSKSVQHTMYAMGESVLDRCESVTRVRFALPNRHHLPVDLSKFGMPNRNEIFVVTREPYGLIEGEMTR